MNSTMKIAARRILRITVERSSRRRSVGRSIPRAKIGMTRSFEIMMESATLSTMTIAVAAERPPMKAASARRSCPASSGTERT